jgi:hypothetical protein
VGTNPEHIMSPPENQEEQVTWIGRDRPAFDRLAPESPREGAGVAP